MNRNLGRNILYGVIVFILMALQTSNILAVFEINPDFLLLIVILHSIHYGEYKGELFGFTIGILEDAFSGTLFGLNAFILTFISWFTGIYKKYIFVSDNVSFLIYVIVATILKYLFYILFYWIFNRSDLLSWYILLKLCGEIAYNVIIGLLFFYLAPMVYKKQDTSF